MQLSEYVGLANRSKHMANLKFQYQKESWFINLHFIYRSKWVITDTDGNGLYNLNDAFAKEFVQINSAVGKSFTNYLSVQIECNNLLNYLDPINMPNIAGRTFYTTLFYQFIKNKSIK